MSKKTITLRWPPTQLQVAWAIVIFFLALINLYTIPAGLIAGGDSGLNIIAWVFIIMEGIVALAWACCIVVEDIWG